MLRYEAHVETKSELLGLVKRRFLRLDIWIEKHCACGGWRWPDTVHFYAAEEAIDSWVTAPRPPVERTRKAQAEFQEDMKKHALYLAPYRGVPLFIMVEIVSRDQVTVDGLFNYYAHKDLSCETLKRSGRDRSVSTEVERVMIRDQHFVTESGREYTGRLCPRCVTDKVGEAGRT
jgi:hypothetical protein